MKTLGPKFLWEQSNSLDVQRWQRDEDLSIQLGEGTASSYNSKTCPLCRSETELI